MAIKHILDRIEADAARSVEEILAEAEKQAEEILAEARDEADTQAAELLRQGKADAHIAASAILSESRISAKRMTTAAKADSIDNIFKRASELLASMPSADYQKLLIRVMRPLLGDDIEEINVLPGDNERLRDEFEAMLHETFGDKCPQLKFPDFSGSQRGLVLRGPNIRIDLSTDSILSMAREHLGPSLAQDILSGGEEEK